MYIKNGENMFYHMNQVGKDTHMYDGNEYEIAVYKADEDNHLRGYISSGGFSDSIVHMSSETASDMRHGTEDPVEMLINTMKDEIDAGKFPVPKNT